jgi:hypothetical protein
MSVLADKCFVRKNQTKGRFSVALAPVFHGGFLQTVGVVRVIPVAKNFRELRSEFPGVDREQQKLQTTKERKWTPNENI